MNPSHCMLIDDVEKCGCRDSFAFCLAPEYNSKHYYFTVFFRACSNIKFSYFIVILFDNNLSMKIFSPMGLPETIAYRFEFARIHQNLILV